MNNQSYFHLSPEAVLKLQKLIGSDHFLHSSLLFYEGQIPTMAFVLVSGELLLLKRNRIQKRLTSSVLVGAFELFHRKESRYTIKLSPDTTLIPIEQSTLTDLVNGTLAVGEIDWSTLIRPDLRRDLFS